MVGVIKAVLLFTSKDAVRVIYNSYYILQLNGHC